MAEAGLFVGLDHSLTAFGLAAVRPDWGLDFHRVRRVTLATPPGPLVPRRAALARDAVEWIRREAGHARVPLTAVRVSVEGGIFMRGKAETIRSQERLAGVVEHELARELGVAVGIAEQRDVRRVFMGSKASGGRGAGDAAQALLRKLVDASWDEAELDAFLVANYAMAEAGEAFVACGPPEPITVKDWGKHNPAGPRRHGSAESAPTKTKPRAA